MECENCKAELDSKSKFCGKCGKNVEDSFFDVDESIKRCRRFWFMIGLYRGICLGEGDKETLKIFENIIIKQIDLFEEYNDAVTFWQNKLDSISKNESK